MPRTLNDETMVRITVPVPDETRDELYAYAAASGLKSSHFFAMALVAGARQLGSLLAPGRVDPGVSPAPAAPARPAGPARKKKTT